MIEVKTLDIAKGRFPAILRPVASDWAPVTPAMRRVELAAGPAVETQCSRLGELPFGSAVITGGGDLAEFMVHVVVRSREDATTSAGVGRALQNGLRRLSEWGIESVTMPPLGTGAGNLDAEESAEVMIPMIRDYMSSSPYPSSVTVAVETEYEREAFERELARASDGTPSR